MVYGGCFSVARARFSARECAPVLSSPSEILWVSGGKSARITEGNLKVRNPSVCGLIKLAKLCGHHECAIDVGRVRAHLPRRG